MPSDPRSSHLPPTNSRDRRRRPRWLLAAVAAGLALVLGSLVGVGFAAAIHRPNVDTVADFKPGLITRFVADDGSAFASYARERRVLLRDGEVPALVQNALVAAEDSHFLEHGGVDLEGIARAALRNLRSGEITQGASTLTMQLARHLFLTQERTWRRKIEEAFLAVELEKSLSKQQILTLYCNIVYFGHGNYGIAAAARDYFDKTVGELTLAEAATLAGIVQQPSRFSPYRRPDLVLARRDYVLRRMLEEGYLDRAAFDQAQAEALNPVQRAPKRLLAPYFAEEIRRRLESAYGSDVLLEGGLEVETTLDPAMQRAAEEALRAGIERLDHRRGWRGPLEHRDAADLESAELEGWSRRGLVPGFWDRGLVLESGSRTARVKVGSTVYELEPRGIEWTRRQRPAELLSPGDVAWFSLRTQEDPELPPADDPESAGSEEETGTWLALEQEPELEGAVLVVESATGAIRALVGGWDYERSKFDRATQARRQVGSAFKPFVYGAALEMGYTPADTLFDGPAVFAGSDGAVPNYSPRNFYRRYYGILTLRWALEHSINTTAVKLQDLVGIDRVIDFARRCGIESDLPPYPSLALGSADLSPLELATAYATIANQGLWVEPWMVSRVLDAEGRVLEEHLPRMRKAAEPPAAHVMARMLQGVVQRGTGQKARDLDIDLAGKTGTTDDYTDAWFVGFTPRYTLLVWVGYDVKRSIGRNMTGAEAALPIWKELVARGLEEGWLRAGERFTTPPGVDEQPVEPASGLLPAPGGPAAIPEWFVQGTAPVRTWTPEWGRVLQLPWFQQIPWYIPKEGERMPSDIEDWSLVEAVWDQEEGV